MASERFQWLNPWISPSLVAVGFLFGNTELSMELWTVIARISGLDND